MSDQERTERAAEELRRLEEGGATLDDVLNGEAGRRWIAESCGGDLELAKAAFRRIHPTARFFDVPGDGR
jgi:hypothetical protein